MTSILQNKVLDNPSIFEQAALLWKNKNYNALRQLLDEQQNNTTTFIQLWSSLLPINPEESDLSKLEALIQLYINKRSLNIDSFYFFLSLRADTAVIKIYMHGIKSIALREEVFAHMVKMVNHYAAACQDIPLADNVICTDIMMHLSSVAQEFSFDSPEYAACQNAIYEIMVANETWLNKKNFFIRNNETLFSFPIQEMVELIISPSYSAKSALTLVPLKKKFENLSLRALQPATIIPLAVPATAPAVIIPNLASEKTDTPSAHIGIIFLNAIMKFFVDVFKFIILGEQSQSISASVKPVRNFEEKNISAMMLEEALKVNPDFEHIYNLSILNEQESYQLSIEEMKFLNPRTYEITLYTLALTVKNEQLLTDKIGLKMPNEKEKIVFKLETFEQCARFSLARRAQVLALEKENKCYGQQRLPIRIAADALTLSATNDKGIDISADYVNSEYLAQQPKTPASLPQAIDTVPSNSKAPAILIFDPLSPAWRPTRTSSHSLHQARTSFDKVTSSGTLLTRSIKTGFYQPIISPEGSSHISSKVLEI